MDYDELAVFDVMTSSIIKELQTLTALIATKQANVEGIDEKMQKMNEILNSNANSQTVRI